MKVKNRPLFSGPRNPGSVAASEGSCWDTAGSPHPYNVPPAFLNYGPPSAASISNPASPSRHANVSAGLGHPSKDECHPCKDVCRHSKQDRPSSKDERPLVNRPAPPQPRAPTPKVFRSRSKNDRPHLEPRTPPHQPRLATQPISTPPCRSGGPTFKPTSPLNPKATLPSSSRQVQTSPSKPPPSAQTSRTALSWKASWPPAMIKVGVRDRAQKERGSSPPCQSRHRPASRHIRASTVKSAGLAPCLKTPAANTSLTAAMPTRQAHHDVDQPAQSQVQAAIPKPPKPRPHRR